jgi:hypothetical protein
MAVPRANHIATLLGNGTVWSLEEYPRWRQSMLLSKVALCQKRPSDMLPVWEKEPELGS